MAQLAADSGLTARGVRIVLQSLVSQGMVSMLGQARSQLYCVALRHPLAGAVKMLFQQEGGWWDGAQEVLREALAARREVCSA